MLLRELVHALSRLRLGLTECDRRKADYDVAGVPAEHIRAASRAPRQLMMAILHDRIQIAKAVNATAISLQDAPRGYAEFDAGAATKYVLNPNGYLSN